jgi:hypothetical protein
VTELVNKELMAQLAEMGFPEVRAEKGLWLTGNESLENAINWLAEHSEDADIDVPLEVDAATANKVIFTCDSPDAANGLSCVPVSVFSRVGLGFRVKGLGFRGGPLLCALFCAHLGAVHPSLP